MVRRSHDYRVARQIVHLHQQRCDDTLDLSGLVDVASFFAHRVELVKEQNARGRSGVVEDAPKPRRGLPEEAADHGFVANDEERYGQGFRDRLGK